MVPRYTIHHHWRSQTLTKKTGGHMVRIAPIKKNDRIRYGGKIELKWVSIDEINSTEYERLLGFYYTIMIIYSIR